MKFVDDDDDDDDCKRLQNDKALNVKQFFSGPLCKKSDTGFRLVPISVSLNDLERRKSPYFALFHQIR